jgi:hypothetical protein
VLEHLPTSESLPYFWRLGVSTRRQPTCLRRAVRGYTDDCALFTLFTAFHTGEGMSTAVAAIKREHIEAFIAAELGRTSASSAATRYRSIQQRVRWLDEKDEVDISPMAKMRKPLIPEQPMPVLP